MLWYLWLIVGLTAGFVAAIFSVAGFAYMATHNPKLQQRVISATMRQMMPKQKTKVRQ